MFRSALALWNVFDTFVFLYVTLCTECASPWFVHKYLVATAICPHLSVTKYELHPFCRSVGTGTLVFKFSNLYPTPDIAVINSYVSSQKYENSTSKEDVKTKARNMLMDLRNLV
jgi:hypothetical protein